MKTKLLVLAGVAALATAGAALAAVTFNPATGTGFVGKGDVQTALSLNNAAMQSAANSLLFTYSETTAYDVDCYWETETGGPNSKIIPHAVTNVKESSINGTTTYDARQRNQITGFTLTGYSSVVVSGGAVPNVGDACPQAHSTAVVTAVTPSPSNGPGELRVNGVLLNYY